MRQSARRGPGGRAWAVVVGLAVVALVLTEPRSEAHAQRFSDAIQKVLLIKTVEGSHDGGIGKRDGTIVDQLAESCAFSLPQNLKKFLLQWPQTSFWSRAEYLKDSIHEQHTSVEILPENGYG